MDPLTAAPPPTGAPRLSVTISDVAAGGDGIGHAPDGRVVFVRGAIPGDQVAIDVIQDRKTMIRGSITSIIEPSAQRTEAPCPHVADGCGGCGWQHVTPDAQRQFKARVAEESLRRLGRLEGEVIVGDALPALGYRTTVRCLVVDGKAAFRADHSHSPVPVDRCIVAHPGLDELITDGYFGDAREVTLRIGAATGERLVRFSPRVPRDIRLPDDVRVVGADELKAGKRAWYHETVADRSFRVSADSFFQTRTDGAEALVAAVRAAGDGYWGSGTFIDLFGGVGLFAGTLGAGMAVTDVESNPSSAADARHNLADLDARIVRVPAAHWSPSPADIVVADPPRAGLGAELVTAIAETGADRLVVVNCDAASFGRDAGLLAQAGYERASTVSLDLFPHTPHVELVSRFDRTHS